MARIRRLILAGVAGAAGLTVFACGKERGSAPRLTLRYHPPAGASYHYTIEQHNAARVESGPLAQVPEQLFAIHMYFRQTVRGPVEGGIGVTIRFDSTTIQSSMIPPGSIGGALDGLRGLTGTVVYDERMNVVRADFRPVAGLPPQIMDQLANRIKGMAFPLPEQPVGVGDSWTSETDLPLGEIVTASGPLKARTRLTVKDINAGGPDTTVLVAVETTFPGGPVTVTSEGVQQTLTVSGSLAGEQLFSITRGAAVHSSMGGKMLAGMSGGPQGKMDLSLRQVMTLQLDEAK